MSVDRLTINIDPVTFAGSFKSIADAKIRRSMCGHDEFNFTEQNKYVINQIYYHLTGSSKYKGNINRNILLTGKHGCGKSTIMHTIKEVIKFNTAPREKIFTMLNVHELNVEVRKNGIEYFYKRPMILDEIGREEKSINDYGNKIHPSMQLIIKRYENNALTYLIGNFDKEELRRIYGMYMFEKINEMFDVLELNDKNWRPDNYKQGKLI